MANTDTTGKDAYGNSAAAAVGTVIEAKGMTITSAGGNAQVLKDAAYNAAYATSITTGTPGDAEPLQLRVMPRWSAGRNGS